MKTVQVKPGKPAKFYVNSERVCLNTAFGMYQKGAKFTVNGKKIKLNENSFGIRNRKMKKKKKKKKKKQVSNNKTAALNIPSELVEKITLMTYGLNPHPTAKLIKENNLMKKKRKATERWDEDSLEWSGQGRKYIGHPGYNRIDVMNMSSDKIRSFMENIPGPYDDYSGSDSYKTRMRNTMRWSSDDVDWYAPAHPGGRAMSREEVVRMKRSNRDIYMNNLPKDANFWSY